jgi:hypothetical protein
MKCVQVSKLTKELEEKQIQFDSLSQQLEVEKQQKSQLQNQYRICFFIFFQVCCQIIDVELFHIRIRELEESNEQIKFLQQRIINLEKVKRLDFVY